jgi:hypothetical protein
MARQFPTYIHYIETEAKSKGEFIIRTIEPKFIAKVNRSGEKFSFDFLEFWDNLDEQKFKGISDHLHNWYKNRILKNSI